MSALAPACRLELVQTHFQGWRAWRLQAGPLCLHVVPEVGGRLMGLAWQGQELAFVHPALAGRLADLSQPLADQGLCVDWHFPLWGGGKTWLAPQSAWPDEAPHPDLDSGAWSVSEAWCDDTRAVLTVRSPVCRHTGLQLSRRLTLRAGPAPSWEVLHTVRHSGSVPIEVGLWDVLMLRRPAVLPLGLQVQALRPTPGQPGRAELLAVGVLVPVENAVSLRCTQALEFKLGLPTPTLVAHWPGGLRYQRQAESDPLGSWAHGCPSEVFNAPALGYFEIESHSPCWRLLPGQQASWRVQEHLTAAPLDDETHLECHHESV